jgi:pilus assembly protein Flp/PilA
LGWLISSLLKKQKERRPKSMRRLLMFSKDDKGASSVEYALLVALVTAVIVGVVTLLGGNLKATFDYIASIFSNP